VEHLGGDVVSVASTGSVDPAVLRAHLAESTDITVVSVMTVNNETGAVTDMEGVSHAVRGRAENAILHTDAVQAACWIDLRTVWPHVDVMTLSAHKFGGPKGMGVMVVREGVHLEPLLFGGGQERDRRSGTHNVAGIVGTATALHVTDTQRADENTRLRALRDDLVGQLVHSIPGAVATVAADSSVAGVAHVCIEGVESESMLYLLDTHNVCVSAASACASGAMEPSHVLEAMGLDKALIKGSLRFSLGHTTTAEDIAVAATSTISSARRLLQVGI
jgi:cysteine desulfurase